MPEAQWSMDAVSSSRPSARNRRADDGNRILMPRRRSPSPGASCELGGGAGIAPELVEQAASWRAAEGHADDSDAMENRILSGIVRRLEGRHNQRAENGNAGVRVMMEPPPMPEPSIERAAKNLTRRRTRSASDAGRGINAPLRLQICRRRSRLRRGRGPCRSLHLSAGISRPHRGRRWPHPDRSR
jgi:hypothetical protein